MFSAFATVALADPGWGWGHHSWWPWGSLMMIGWWLLVAALVVFAVRSRRGDDRVASGPAERLLADRYARGEIDESEYRTRLGVLQERP